MVRNGRNWNDNLIIGGMVMWEIKRIFSRKIIIFLMLLLISNMAIFAYVQLSGKTFAQMKKENDTYNELIDRFSKDDLDIALENVKEEYDEVRRNRKTLLRENNSIELDDYSRLENSLELVKEKLGYLAGFEADVNNVLVNVEKMQKFSLFNDKSSFAYSNLVRTQSDFNRIKGLRLSLDNDRAVDAFVNYYYLYYIVMAFMITIIYSIFLERENGMWQLVHSSKEGREKVALKRILIILTSTYFILALFYITTAVEAFAIYGGWRGLSEPIQTISLFRNFTYAYSRAEYMLMLYLLSGFVICGLSLILWMIFTIFRNRNHTLVAIAVFVGLEILIYQKVSIHSVYSVFHHINIVSLLKFTELYRGYLNWGIGQYVFSVVSIIIFTLLITITASCIAGVLRYEAMMPSGRASVITKITGRINESYQRILEKFPVSMKELHKLIFTGKGVWVVVFIVTIAIYFSSYGIMKFTDAEKERDAIYQSQGGQDYVEIEAMIAQTQDNYHNAVQKLENASKSYADGGMDLGTYDNYMSEVEYYQQELGSLKEFIAKKNHIEELSEKGISAWMISDRGYEEIFGQYSNQRELIILIALVTGIMMIVSESITMEYRSGMAAIIRGGKQGRNWILIQKIVACMILSIGLTAIVYGIDMVAMVRIYGMPYMDAPLASLTFMKDVVAGTDGGILSRIIIELFGTAITIKDWLVIRITSRIVIALITMLAAIVTSRTIGRKGNRSVMLGVLAVVLITILLLRNSCGVL